MSNDPGGIERTDALSVNQVEPLTDHSREVFDEFGLDPFEAPDADVEENYDPLESYNVVMFKFNYKLDKYLLKPVAQGYNFIMPHIAQKGIHNGIRNIRFAPRMFNNLFQAKFKGAGIEMSRFLINSTVGIGGFFDPAKRFFNLDTPLEDTGQTLGVYGVPPGAYIVLPLFGPFTARDLIGYVGDVALDPFNWLVLPITEIDGAPWSSRTIRRPPLFDWGIKLWKSSISVR